MRINEIHKIRKIIYELSPQSSGVEEFLAQVKENPELIKYLNFPSYNDLKEFITDSGYEEFQQLKKEADRFTKERKSTFESEMDEMERTVQYLNRQEGIDISVDDLLKAFQNAKEMEITPQIWRRLENTESNTIRKGEIRKVIDLADKYNKTNPMELKKSLLSGDYKKPLILNFDNRYYLVAGNTRLSTSAALGIKPKILLAKI